MPALNGLKLLFHVGALVVHQAIEFFGDVCDVLHSLLQVALPGHRLRSALPWQLKPDAQADEHSHSECVRHDGWCRSSLTRPVDGAPINNRHAAALEMMGREYTFGRRDQARLAITAWAKAGLGRSRRW